MPKPATKFDAEAVLKKIPRPAVSQTSLKEQMIELRAMAVHFGLYDADDWLYGNFFRKSY